MRDLGGQIFRFYVPDLPIQDDIKATIRLRGLVARGLGGRTWMMTGVRNIITEQLWRQHGH